jgi:sugar lactone lactonase YvrE
MRLQSIMIPSIVLSLAFPLTGLTACGGHKKDKSADITTTTPPTTTYLAIADVANNRVLLYDSPFTTGMSASGVLGQSTFTTGVANTTAAGLYSPRAIKEDSEGNFWVADEYNNRVLEFVKPFSSGMSASLVIGQNGFTTGGSSTSQSGLLDPFDLAFDSAGNLWVADTFNHRILEFQLPFSTGMNASLVIGQQNFTSQTFTVTASGLSNPWGIAFDSTGNLWVSDSSNNRIPEFKPPFATGMNASLVIGQQNFTSQIFSTTAAELDGPMEIAFDSNGNLWVVDSGNNRVLEFTTPFSTGMSVSLVIGQDGFTTNSAVTSQSSLQNPAGLAFDSSGNLWVTDSNNNRTLEFASPFSTGENASLVLGQENFTTDTRTTAAGGQATPMGIVAF